MAIVFVPLGIHNAYNEGAEKGANYMYSEEYNRKL